MTRLWLSLFALLLAAPRVASPSAELPTRALPWVEGRSVGNYELHADFRLAPGGHGRVDLGAGQVVLLTNSAGRPVGPTSSGALAGGLAPTSEAARPAGQWQSLDVSFTRFEDQPALVSVWLNGVEVQRDATAPGPPPDEALYVAAPEVSQAIDWGRGFSVWARFRARRGGTIFSLVPDAGAWGPGAAALSLRRGQLAFAVGGAGEVASRRRFSDGAWHTAVLSVDTTGRVALAVDGERVAGGPLALPAGSGGRVTLGRATADFGGRFGGDLARVALFEGAVADPAAASAGGVERLGPPAWAWSSKWLGSVASEAPLSPVAPGVALEPIGFAGQGFETADVWVRPLAGVDHAAWITGFDEASLQRGEALYQDVCAQCHGADGRRPSLDGAPALGVGPFRFGTDPLSLFETLTEGRGRMGPQTWMSVADRYAVVQYVRERLMRPLDPGFEAFDADDIAALPRPVARVAGARGSPLTGSKARDFGPALGSAIEGLTPAALTVRLGGQTALAYDLHTGNQAAVWSGGFLDLTGTQHHRLRGERPPRPAGALIDGLAGWRWGHGGDLDAVSAQKPPRGPVPEAEFAYRGYHLHGDQVVLDYAVDGRPILELAESPEDFPALLQTLRIGPGSALKLGVGRPDWRPTVVQGVGPDRRAEASGEGPAGEGFVLAAEGPAASPGRFVAAAVVGDVAGLRWAADSDAGLVLTIPASDSARDVQVVRYAGEGAGELQAFEALLRHRRAQGPPRDLSKLLEGGPLRWPMVLETRGTLGPDDEPYTLDTLGLPASTPWGSWMRISAIDFLDDGRLVATTLGGEVWLVSGVDEDLDALRWKRFAAGLFEPLGVKVIDDTIYVTCRDRIVRLHDRNGDDEADFYESFNADTDVSMFFHAYNFDLQTDADGALYYAKAGQLTDHALPGAVIRVSPDGRERSVVCTGFRMPNGLGVLPDGRVTVSDNQGNWIPASKISVCEPGGFYGYVQTHAEPGDWAPDGGAIDHRAVPVPESFDPPLVWMPQDVDNSSGGQVYAGDPRWGPLSGRMLHTSFGKGWLYSLLLQDVEGGEQAAVLRVPLDFESGIHRARVNPADGQVYVAGLSGWNTSGRRGLAEGGIQRVRYTGAPGRYVTGWSVEPGGVRLRFDFPLDPATATEVDRYTLEHWNYRWSADYGSAHWSPSHRARKGAEPLPVASVVLDADGQGVFLAVPGLRPVDQVRLNLSLAGDDGVPFEEELHFTVRRLGTEDRSLPGAS